MVVGTWLAAPPARGLDCPQFEVGRRTCGPGSGTSRHSADEPASMSATLRLRRTPPGQARGCPPRWSGRRPCAWDPATGSRRRYPWGEPRSPQTPMPTWVVERRALRRYPPGHRCGAEQMLGDVWGVDHLAAVTWPGLVPMVYERQSQPFFGGDYRVLRGRLGRWSRPSCGPASATGITVSPPDLCWCPGWRGHLMSSPRGGRGTGRGFFRRCWTAAGLVGARYAPASAKSTG